MKKTVSALFLLALAVPAFAGERTGGIRSRGRRVWNTPY